MKTNILLTAAGLAVAFTGAANAAVLHAVPGTLSGSFAAITDAPNTTGNSFGPYAVGGNTVTFSSVNTLEINNQSTLIDSNFAANTTFVTQCGYAGIASCTPTAGTTLTFANPVFYFTLAADSFDTSSPYVFTVTAYNVFGNPVGALSSTSVLADNGTNPAILAGQSTVGITRLVLTDALAPGAVDNGFTGNFVIADIGVPEPSSVAMLAFGLFGLAGLARRAR